MSTTTATETSTLPRLKQRYREEIVPALRGQFDFANVMQVPTVTKVVVNMGVGDAARDAKLIEGAIRDLQAITGQKPAVTKARRSIAQFKLREGMPIGAHVTLRGDRMWVSGPAHLDRTTHPRLQGLVAEAVRRPGQLHLWSHRAGGVPRDQPGHHRPGSWHGHHSRDDRRGPAIMEPCCGFWAFPSRRTDVAKKALINKANAKPKFAVRAYSRCQRCGRPHSVYRKFGLCRCVCARWRTAANSPASPSPVGNRSTIAEGPTEWPETTAESGATTMTMIDPIADMLTRLRNANSAYHDTVGMPYSKLSRTSRRS